jgi:hypothetical protein
MTFRACSSSAPTRVKPQPAPAILSQESVHTTLSITHHTRKRPSTGPWTTHGPHRVEGFWVPSRPETRIGGIVEACRDCASGGCKGVMGVGPGGGEGAGARPRSPGGGGGSGGRGLRPTGPQAKVRWGSSAPHHQVGQDGRFLRQRGVGGLPAPLAGFRLGTAGKFCSFYKINLPPL